MKRVAVISGLLVWVAAVVVQAGNLDPKPGPEHKKMEIFVGDWTYQQEINATPLGPAAKLNGTVTARMVLGGFFVEWRGEGINTSRGISESYEEEEDPPRGAISQWIEMDGYDADAKRYTSNYFDSHGNSTAGTYTIEGNTMTYEGTGVLGGKQFKFRGALVVAADLNGFVDKMEIKVVGRTTWQPFFENKAKKAATK